MAQALAGHPGRRAHTGPSLGFQESEPSAAVLSAGPGVGRPPPGGPVAQQVPQSEGGRDSNVVVKNRRVYHTYINMVVRGLGH